MIIVFVFLLAHHYKINLPKTIFNHLKESIKVSRAQPESYIPYGRILYELMVREGIWETLRINGPEGALAEDKCARVDDVEDFED